METKNLHFHFFFTKMTDSRDFADCPSAVLSNIACLTSFSHGGQECGEDGKTTQRHGNADVAVTSCRTIKQICHHVACFYLAKSGYVTGARWDLGDTQSLAKELPFQHGTLALSFVIYMEARKKAGKLNSTIAKNVVL